MRISPRVRAVFFDDQPSNFEDKELCESVLIVRSRAGRHDKSFVKRFPFMASWEDDGEAMFFKDAGVPEADLRAWANHLATEQSHHIRLVVFDWDRTLSTWDGLNGGATAAWIRGARKRGVWPALRDALFITGRRARVLAGLLSLLQTQRRVNIVTNQGDSRAVKAVLNALAQDFRLPNLAQVPVMARKERKNATKFEFFRSKLKEECDL